MVVNSSSSRPPNNPIDNPWPSMKSVLSRNLKESKHQLIQAAGVGILLLVAARSLGRKYLIRELEDETAALRQERDNLTQRMDNIKSSLIHEASLDSTGIFAARLRRLFGESD